MSSHSFKQRSVKPAVSTLCPWRSTVFCLRWIVLVVAVAISGGVGAAAQATGDDEANGPTVAFVDGRLTVEATNAPLASVLRRIARAAGVDIAVYGQPESMVSIRFEGLRLDDGLNRLLGQYNLVLLYREVKDAGPDEPRMQLTGLQIHVEPGANETMNFRAGRLVEMRKLARKREEQRKRRLKTRDATATNLAASPHEDPAQVVARLKVAAFDEDPSVREDAVDELTMMDDETAASDILEKVLREDPNPEVRANAIGGLEDLEQPPAETVLDVALFDESPEVRIGAMEIIGDQEWKDQRTVDTLSRVLNDSNEEVRLTALEILGDLEERPALEAAARSNPHEDVRELAAELLGEMQP